MENMKLAVSQHCLSKKRHSNYKTICFIQQYQIEGRPVQCMAPRGVHGASGAGDQAAPS